MKLTWYGHSCFKLESGYGSIVFDPYKDGFVPGLQLPQLEADMVLCSHTHGDHNAEEKVTLSGREPECVTEQLCSWHDDERGARRGMNVIHIVTMEGVRVAHLGDQGCQLPPVQIKAIGHVQALLIPVGGKYTLDAAAAKELADSINADVVIPMHTSGEGYGLEGVATVDAFAALCGDAERTDSSSVELRRGMGRKTLIMRPDSQCILKK